MLIPNWSRRLRFPSPSSLGLLSSGRHIQPHLTILTNNFFSVEMKILLSLSTVMWWNTRDALNFQICFSCHVSYIVARVIRLVHKHLLYPQLSHSNTGSWCLGPESKMTWEKWKTTASSLFLDERTSKDSLFLKAICHFPPFLHHPCPLP